MCCATGMGAIRVRSVIQARVRSVAATLLTASTILLLTSAMGGPAMPSAPAAGPAVQTRPNIVFIYADDLDRKLLRHMPHVQRLLVRQGTTFYNFLYNISLCCPSRATMLRGQYAHNTGVLSNSPIDGGFRKVFDNRIERSTVATWLQSSGYATGYFGKYFNDYGQTSGVPASYVPPGWTEWFGNGGGAYDGYGYRVNHNGVLRLFGTAPQHYSNDVVSDAAADFIARRVGSDRPFYLTVSPFAPHHPFVPAPRHADLFANAIYPKGPGFNEADVSDKPFQPPPLTTEDIAVIDQIYRQRLRAVQSIDEMVARLVNQLRAAGELGNTVIAFTSDNGFHLGEHRLGRGTGAKFTAYEEDIRVPLVIRGPRIPAGAFRGALVGNVDVPVSFAEVAGVLPPSFVDGRSFMRLLRDTSTGWRNSYLLQRPPSADRPFFGVRTLHHTYVEYRNGFRELYDLRTDPHQLTNIASTAAPSVVNALRDRLVALKACTSAACRSADSRSLPQSLSRVRWPRR